MAMEKVGATVLLYRGGGGRGGRYSIRPGVGQGGNSPDSGDGCLGWLFGWLLALFMAWLKLGNFSGRMNRAEFWRSTLPILAGWIAGLFASGLLSIVPGLFEGIGVLIWGIVSLAGLPVIMGRIMRRLHDTTLTGWWLLLGLAPGIGWIVLLIICALPGAGGPNAYGTQPVGATQKPDPGEAVLSVFRNCLNFSGRAPRWEFWWYALFFFMAEVSLLLSWFILPFVFIRFLMAICELALLLPLCALTVRRLRDANRSLRWLSICPIIVLGWIAWAIAGFALFGNAFIESEIPEDARWAYSLFISMIGWGLVTLAGLATLLILCALPGAAGPVALGAPAATGALPPPRYCTRCGAARQPGAQSCAACGVAF